MNFVKICFFSLVLLLLSCEKKVEDNLAGYTWQYEATYTVNSTNPEIINATGTFYFKEDFSGKQIENGQFSWDFNWSTSSKYVYIEYKTGGALNYTIKVNKEKLQEWTSDAYYVYPDNSSFPASIKMKLSR